MRKVLAIAAITGFMLTLCSVADARGGPGFGGFGAGGFAGSRGVSGFSPGHMFRNQAKTNPCPDCPGASGWAPGRRMQMNEGPGYTDETTGQYYPGATYWTPPVQQTINGGN